MGMTQTVAAAEARIVVQAKTSLRSQADLPRSSPRLRRVRAPLSIRFGLVLSGRSWRSNVDPASRLLAGFVAVAELLYNGLMADYRLYCLDQNGGIGLADWIEADTDDEAVKIARTMRPDAHKCEVWLQDRLIGTLTPEGRFIVAPLSESAHSPAR